MAGNGTGRSFTEFGSMPSFSSAARIITSPTPFNALTAIVLPARSAGVRIELEPLTRMFCQLSVSDVPSTSLVVIVVIGTPFVRAIIAGTQPANPISVLLFASARTMSLPLCRITFLTSRFCCSKNPFLIPRSSGRVFEIGMTVTVIESRVDFFTKAPAVAPPNSAATTTDAAASTITCRPARPLRRRRRGFNRVHPYLPASRGTPCRRGSAL